MNRVRVVLIGAGMMANNVHYPSVASFSDVEIVGLCDLDKEKLKATAAKFSIQETFRDYREMLDKTKPDAAYALMPPHVLFEPAMDVLERGVHLFIEKPACNTRVQAESLALTAEKKGLVTMVGFQRRYHPLLTCAYAKVAEYGPIRQVVGSFYKSQPFEMSTYYRGAIDILSTDCVHVVDALRYFAGGEPVCVKSVVKRVGKAAYDNFHLALIEFGGGVTGVLLTNWLSGRRQLTMEFHSEGAAAFVDIDGAAEISANNEKVETVSLAEIAGSEEEYIAQGFYAENRAFIDCVKAGKQPHNNIADAVATWKLVEAIYANTINE